MISPIFTWSLGTSMSYKKWPKFIKVISSRKLLERPVWRKLSQYDLFSPLFIIIIPNNVCFYSIFLSYLMFGFSGCSCIH